jgi:hypothetical protein
MAGLALVYLGVTGVDALTILASSGSPIPIVRGFLAGSSVVMTLALVAYAISPFLAMRLPLKYGSSILAFPFYLGWKLLISIGGRPQQWVRTMREPQR